MSTFGVGFDSAAGVFQPPSSMSSESLARRALAASQDPVFQKQKEQFVADFDFRFVYFLFFSHKNEILFTLYVTYTFTRFCLLEVCEMVQLPFRKGYQNKF